MTEENTPIPISQTNTAPTPQAIPVTADAPVILSQVPPMAFSDAKPVVDKPKTIAAPTLGETK